MGAKAKKASKKKLQKATTQLSVASKNDTADFLPLEGGPARKLPQQKPLETGATIVYIGRIPHGFYEEEMKAYFSQFGTIKRLRISRNKKTGKSKHYGFIEFEHPGIAEIVADAMHNYLLFEHLLQVHVVPPERVPPKLWRGYKYQPKRVDWAQIERKKQDKERTLEEHQKLLQKIARRDQKRRKRIASAGIEYECPELIGLVQPGPKKIKFADEQEQ